LCINILTNEDIYYAIAELIAVWMWIVIMNITSFHGIKKARLRRDGQVNGLPCVWLQGMGGTSTQTLLPDTRAVSYGITDIED
jgi:hypothetical protein